MTRIEEEGKGLRLFGTIFLFFMGILVCLFLLFMGMRLVFGLLNYLPWLTYLYMGGIVLLPAALFLSIYHIYSRRSMKYPRKGIRIVSVTLIVIAALCWLAALIRDAYTFFKSASPEIASYWSYSMIFLAANVLLIFMIGIIQALGSPPEKDWMDRSRVDG